MLWKVWVVNEGCMLMGLAHSVPAVSIQCLLFPMTPYCMMFVSFGRASSLQITGVRSECNDRFIMDGVSEAAVSPC